MVPKLVRAVTQIKAAIMSYYPQYFAVIAHNIEHHCDFGSALPPEELHIIPGGNLPPVWEPLFYYMLSHFIVWHLLHIVYNILNMQHYATSVTGQTCSYSDKAAKRGNQYLYLDENVSLL